ncbi:MAG: trypsin-like peptidase domain-containing protein [Enterobacterales bacterium]|nr:trypsin-like peptidase domain-containing protein [Enterobacterales bacterium]
MIFPLELAVVLFFHPDGYIVTNYHVIVGSSRIAVHFSDGRRKYAKVVGFDQQNDIAVLKVNIRTPKVADLGDSSLVRTGDVVLAIGTPFGLFKNSVTMGIISAIDHGPFHPRIQTDASINFGNSGGALINAKGQVIGISSAKFSIEKNDEIGINFGTPIDTVKEIFTQLIKHGRVARNWLGVGLNQLNQAGHKHFQPGIAFGVGLLVSNIEKGSPGDRAGLKVEDYLIRFDGVEVTSMIQFRELFISIPIGKEVEIEVLRKQKLIKLTLKLRERES